MTTRVCLVTGATSGIGKAVARILSERGFAVVVAGRHPEKTSAVCEELATITGSSTLYPLVADFSSLDAVSEMAFAYRQQFGELHVLFNNAGLLTDHRQLSADGFELTLAVNHLAPFLLTQLLLPTLYRSQPSRIIFNSSSAMGGGVIRLDDLNAEHDFDGWSAYANSKLANYLCSNLLAEKLSDQCVVSNALCPGLIDTNLLTDSRDFGPELMARLKMRMRTPAEGAVTPVYLATAAEAGDISGQFFLSSHGREVTPVQIPWSRNTAILLWEASMRMVESWLESPAM
jgi:retinol dehydrogenase-12